MRGKKEMMHLADECNGQEEITSGNCRDFKSEHWKMQGAIFSEKEVTNYPLCVCLREREKNERKEVKIRNCDSIWSISVVYRDGWMNECDG